MPDANSPWAAPGAEPAVSGPPAPVPAGAVAPAPTADALPPVPVAVGPMTVADVLDGAFEILKRRPREAVTIAAVAALPLHVIVTVLFRDHLGSELFTLDPQTGLGPRSLAGTYAATIGLLFVSSISLAWTCGALSVLVSDWYRGVPTPAGLLLRRTLGRVPALTAAVVLVKVVQLVGFMGCFLGAVLAMCVFHVTSPVIALENANPIAAMRRSFRLTTGQFSRSLAVPVLTGLVGFAVSSVFTTITGLAMVLAGEDRMWIAAGAGQLISNIFLLPFTAGVATLYYLDLRIRREGIDIEESARAVFGR